MHWFSDELKKAREARNISLHTVASATNISLRILNALERGDYFFLPHAYMRAFIKEYSSCIGLNAAETARRFDEAIKEMKHQQDAEGGSAAEAGKRETFTQMPRRMFSQFQSWITDNVPQVFITSLGVLLLIVVSWLFLHLSLHETDATAVREVPFQQVLKESEQAAETAAASGLVLLPKDQGASVSVDSLILRATATDSVWMSIVIDEQDTSEYLFGPRDGKTWKAQNHFSISLGNAGGMFFTLNDQLIGSLGKSGAVVHDVMLSQRELTHQE